MKKFIPIASYLLNLLLIGVLIVGYLKYKDDIKRKVNRMTTKADIVMFGDSITKEGNWNTLIPSRTVVNSGYPGITTSSLEKLVGDRVAKYSPEYCFVAAGINDMLVGIPLARTKRNYESILEQLTALNITPVVQSTLFQTQAVGAPTQDSVDSLNQFLKDYCSSHSLTFLDLNLVLSNKRALNPNYSTDGTHLNVEAYGEWGKEIDKFLTR